jgi:hypothetical protein
LKMFLGVSGDPLVGLLDEDGGEQKVG